MQDLALDISHHSSIFICTITAFDSSAAAPEAIIATFIAGTTTAIDLQLDLQQSLINLQIDPQLSAEQANTASLR